MYLVKEQMYNLTYNTKHVREKWAGYTTWREILDTHAQ